MLFIICIKLVFEPDHEKWSLSICRDQDLIGQGLPCSFTVLLVTIEYGECCAPTYSAVANETMRMTNILNRLFGADIDLHCLYTLHTHNCDSTTHL